jgi:hypothetical protein
VEQGGKTGGGRNFHGQGGRQQRGLAVPASAGGAQATEGDAIRTPALRTGNEDAAVIRA